MGRLTTFLHRLARALDAMTRAVSAARRLTVALCAFALAVPGMVRALDWLLP